MTALANRTDLQQTRGTGADRLPTPRGTTLLPLVISGAAALGGVVSDEGTRVVPRADYRPMIEGTSLQTVHIEGPVTPFQTSTRMAQIRALAPLSFRDWAPVFGVSHSAIKQWTDGDEPSRDKLDRVLGALSDASIHQADLAAWLAAPLPGMQTRPLDLLLEERWRAFRGAIRTRVAPVVAVTPEELKRRRRAQVSWVVAEPATVADEA